MTHDLTEQRLAEEAQARANREEGARAASEAAQAELRASGDQLQAILEGVAEGVTAQDASGRLVYANDAAARLCGFDTAQALLNAPPGDILARFQIFNEHGAPFPTDKLPGRMAFSGSATPEVLLRFRVRETGEERWSLDSATPVLDSNGQVQLTVSIFRDITEHKRAEASARFMAAASEELSGSLDYDSTLQKVAQLAVPMLAGWCVVDIVGDDGEVRRLAVAHVDPAKVRLAAELSKRYPEDPNSPTRVSHVLRTRESELWSEITNEQVEAGARDAEHLQILRSLQLRSVIIAPMVARGRTLGAITFVGAESGHQYGPNDLVLAEELAARAALAVDNARLYSEAQRQAATQLDLNAQLQQA